MNDQTVPDVTDDDRKLAREWAEGIEANPKSWSLLTRTAARVVLDTVPVPDPPRPTLADMTDEERAACKWMQADVEDYSTRCVITDPYDAAADTGLVSAIGEIVWASPGRVTPRPDLPRLEWPGDQKPAPALPDGWRLADHKDYGRVIVTTQTPDRDGYVYVVIPADDPMGYDWLFCKPAELTYLDQEADQ